MRQSNTEFDLVRVNIAFDNSVRVILPAERAGYRDKTLTRTPTRFELDMMKYDLRYILIECGGKLLRSKSKNGERTFVVTVPRQSLDQLKYHVRRIDEHPLHDKTEGKRIPHWPKLRGFSA